MGCVLFVARAAQLKQLLRSGPCCVCWVPLQPHCHICTCSRDAAACDAVPTLALALHVQVVKMSLFNTFSSKSVRLEEFEQVQFAATDSVANHLRDNWTASIKSIIKYARVAGDCSKHCRHVVAVP